MSVVVVFGDAGDGYLRSSNATYATARTGSGLAAFTNVSPGFCGQGDQGSSYVITQSFIKFTFPAVGADKRVAAAIIQLAPSAIGNASISRTLEIRGKDWSPGGLTTADWLTPTALGAATLYGQVNFINQANGKYARCGSEDLRLHAASGATSASFVVTTDRQRTGTVPTVDEGVALHLSTASGTTNDPSFTYTTVPVGDLLGVLGASAQLSDQTFAALRYATAGTTWFEHFDGTGAVDATIGTLPMGTTAGTFAEPVSAQSLAVVTDPSDNLYVVGRAGHAVNSIAVQAWTKTGPTSWSAGAVRYASLPSHSTNANQVAATYLGVNGGTVMVLASHSAGVGTNANPADTAWISFSAAVLLGGAGTLSPGTADAVSLMDTNWSVNNQFGGPRNETGSGMDIANSPTNPDWFYTNSWERHAVTNENDSTSMGRGILSSTAATLTHASYADDLSWGRKDAGAKTRIVGLSGGLAAQVTTDADSGYGLTCVIRQHVGTDPGSTLMGWVTLGEESIASLPDGPAISQSAAWDALYNATENKLWIYYVDVANVRRIMRTSVSLDTFVAVGDEVEVGLIPVGQTVQAIRVPRNAVTTARTLVTVATASGGVGVGSENFLDTFAIAPTAPVQAIRSGFDATTAATFSWTFVDPNPGDTQSAYRLQIENNASPGVTVFDSNKTASAVSSRVLTGGTLTNGNSYRWRVRTWDAGDLQSPYSGWQTFATGTGGTVTITSPATDNPPGISTDEVQLAWSVSGTTQASYRVELYRGASLVSDTGWVTSTATTYLVTGMTSDTQHEIRVRVRNAALVESNTGTRLVTPTFATPEVPIVTATPDPEGGFIAVTVSNPAPGEPSAGFSEWDFETAVPGTFTTTLATFAKSTEQAYRGTGSGKLIAAGGGTPKTRAPLATPVTAGLRYTVRFWVYTATSRDVRAAIDWYAGAGLLSSSTAEGTIPAATWTLLVATGTAPATTDGARYGVDIVGSPSAGVAIYVDDMILTAASDRPDVVQNQVYRRKANNGTDWTLIGTCPPDGEFRDYRAASGTLYEYKAVASDVVF